MRIFRNIIVTLLLLVLAAISVVGIMIEWPPVLHWTPNRINAIGRSVLAIMRPDMFLVWLLLFLSTLFVFFATIIRPRKRMKIEVQMGGGRVVIMDAAIKKYVRNALSELGEVTIRKIDLREHRGLVVTDITADVRTKENLPILERRIISRVRAALAEDLGITNLGDVHVFIRNFEVSGRAISPTGVSADSSGTAPEKQATPEKADSAEKTFGPENESAIHVPPAAVPDAAPLSEPVETSGAEAQPIILNDTDSSQNRFGILREDAPTADSTADADRPGVTESSDSEPVILEDKPLFGQTEKSGVTPHEDMDEPLPWGQPYSVTKDDDEEKDENKKDFRPL